MSINPLFFSLTLLVLAIKSDAKRNCFDCKAEADSCFENRCQGVQCYKARGYFNGKLIVKESCSQSTNKTGCFERKFFYEGIGSVDSIFCRCDDRDYCNTVPSIRCSIYLVIFIQLFIGVKTFWN